MRRKRDSVAKSYNLQGWTDVRKIVQVIQHFRSTGIRINTMSDLLTTIIDIRCMVADRAGIPIPETIPEAFDWLRDNGFTTVQYETTSKRQQVIASAMEDEDKAIEQAAVITKHLMNDTSDTFDRSMLAGPIVSPSLEKYPLEPEEHKGTCHHRGLILDDGINCHKCGFFVPNEIEEKEESNELQHS